MSEWPVRPLGEMVDVLDFKRVPLSAAVRASRLGAVPYYGAAGQVGWIDEAIFDEDLVLLGEDGVQFFDPARTKAYRISGPSWVNNHAHVLRVRGDFDWRFLTYFLNQFDYRGFANGTTRLKLTQAAMRKIPVMVPPLDVQRRIVDLLEDHLSRLDAAEAGVRTARVRSASMLESAIRHDLRASEATTVRLSEILAAPLANGRSVPTVEGGFPVLRLTALGPDSMRLDERKPGDWSADDARPFLVHEGDFMVSRGNGSLKLVGRGAVVGPVDDAVAFPDTMIRIRPDQSRMSTGFLARAWNARAVRRQIEGLARTTAGIYKVNQRQLLGIEIPTVDVESQARLVARWAEISQRVSRLEAEASAAEQHSASLRRALLAAAFSGQLTGAASDLERVEEMAFA